ncbi:MAG: hypothetical protein F9K37_03210 [Bacteroidales bacterium]|nr:MAG: hypothetical protein F9K37_03210 [Bacteroidales bacterium]
MKTKSLFVFVLVMFFAKWIVAQDIEATKKIPSTYDRSAVTLFYVQFSNEAHASEIQSKIDKISFSDKYYNNNLNQITLPNAFTRKSHELIESLSKYMNDQQVGRQVISKWYARQDDGTMNMDLIFDRGMFNATDAAYIKAQSTKLGNAVLQDYGNRLIGRSYILVLDYQSIQTMKEAKMSGMKGWKSTVTGYLFKVKYNEETQNAVYDAWIYPEDSPAIKAEKNKKYEQIQVPVEFVTKTTVYVTASQPAEDTQLGRLMKQKSEDELLSEMVQKGYDESLYFLEKNHEDFMVKTTIYQVRPIRAKIGKKEGLKCDNRYFAYEYVYDEKTNTTKPRFRGVIRATSSIVDNRQVAKGDMPTSKFYQTSGRRLRTGYLLRQQNDYGIEATLGFEAGEVGGIYGRVDARMGRYIGVKALFVYVEGGAQMKDYPVAEGIAFLHYGAGLAKGLMLTRNVELRPYIGLGQEQATHDDWSDNGAFKVLYLKAGANLALNLKHNFQLMGGMGFYSFIGNAENDNGDTGFLWEDLFTDRKGPSAMFGVKFMF